jgi:hypothetical protein
MDFTYAGKNYLCSSKAKFLVESANGTSSYTLDRGFGANPEEAIRFYDELPVGGSRKKRLTMVDSGKRTIIART